MSEIIDGIIHETQEEHDRRIAAENVSFRRGKKYSRNKTKTDRVRWDILRRANDCCEICGYNCPEILHIHHILPVEFGGMPYYYNLLAVCQNCHALIHRQASRAPAIVRPEKLATLTRTGMSEEQAKTLLLVATFNARVNQHGTVEPYDNREPPTPCFITDDPKNTPEAKAKRAAEVEAALRRIEERFGQWEKSDVSNTQTQRSQA